MVVELVFPALLVVVDKATVELTFVVVVVVLTLLVVEKGSVEVV